MADMTGWDVAILAVAAYVAVISLVRLMRARRDALVAQVRGELMAQRQRKARDASPRVRGDQSGRGGRTDGR
ncbi:MAG: hypothetical protein MUF48_11440 [Pirellulaceae bacterium]|jgi:type II secretory pathway pseudopilin PulG|nr:hypothetical protein [Pirellulaceae bacterium]